MISYLPTIEAAQYNRVFDACFNLAEFICVAESTSELYLNQDQIEIRSAQYVLQSISDLMDEKKDVESIKKVEPKKVKEVEAKVEVAKVEEVKPVEVVKKEEPKKDEKPVDFRREIENAYASKEAAYTKGGLDPNQAAINTFVEEERKRKALAAAMAAARNGMQYE